MQLQGYLDIVCVVRPHCMSGSNKPAGWLSADYALLVHAPHIPSNC